MTVSDENFFAELLGDYVAECLPLAERVADALLALESDGGDAAWDGVRGLKGPLHTVKGNSSMMGVTAAQQVAHALEDLCDHAADPARRDRAAAALLADGAALLVELVRTAPGNGSHAQRAAAFVARARGTASPSAPSTAPAASAVPTASDDTVRVDFHRLDAMLEMFGEAMVAQEAIRESQRRLAARHGSSPEVVELDAAAVAMQKSLKRLEVAVLETRLVPVATVFGRFTRQVRELAQGAGRRVRLETAGGETLLDKTIVDRLGEPLIHLVNNAIVHGVEPPEERAAAGKPEEATIVLRAAPVSSQVVVTIADDGRGLDAAKILARAERLGIAPASTAAADVHALIFTPGLSTADQVSSLAGRGVGLDVVAAAIHALGGTIEVRSEPGRGTAFRLGVPLTLAIVRALVVEVGGERFAIPLRHVAETLRVEADAIHEIARRGVLVWRDELLPVVEGAQVLGAPAGGSRRMYCVVVAAGGKRRGLLVDRLHGHQDIVVKGLDDALGRTPLVSGTTILGDGRVACILDAPNLVERRDANWRTADVA